MTVDDVSNMHWLSDDTHHYSYWHILLHSFHEIFVDPTLMKSPTCMILCNQTLHLFSKFLKEILIHIFQITIVLDIPWFFYRVFGGH